MALKHARARVEAMSAEQDEGVRRSFDDFLAQMNLGPSLASAHKPGRLASRPPKVAGRIFPPNAEVDAHHDDSRRQSEENAGRVLHCMVLNAEKANFREAAGAGAYTRPPDAL